MKSNKSRPAYPILSLEKTISILDALRDADGPLGITELSSRLGMTNSAVHRHLDTLNWHQMVEQDPATLKYALGTRLIEYGSKALLGLGFNERTHRHLEHLASEVSETVNLCLLRGNEALFVDKIESQEFLRFVTYVGIRVPLHCTGVGKAMLAYLPESEVEKRLGPGPFKRYTPVTVTDPKVLRNRLCEVRTMGYAIDIEEYLPGVLCIAAPILVRDIAAVSVSGPISRLGGDQLPKVAALVKAAAEDITREMTRGLLG